MAITRIKPLKNDSNEGYEEDFDPSTDAVDARGVYIQDDTSDDTNVLVSRDSSGNLTFKDTANPGGFNLTQLTSGGGISEAAHKTLRQLIHLADEGGPWEGFASGAYQETVGGAFPTSIIWWTDSGKTDKIVEETITYNANKTVATDEWKVYDTDGSTVLATVTDTISYTGVFETSRTRTIT